MQLLSLVNGRKKSGEITESIETFPSEGINRFFTPKKPCTDELLLPIRKQDSAGSRSNESDTSIEQLATKSKPNLKNTGSTNQKKRDTDSKDLGTSNIMLAGTHALQASTYCHDAESLVPTRGQEKGSGSRAEQRSCPKVETLKNGILNSLVAGAIALTLQDMEGKEAPLVDQGASQCFPSQHSLRVQGPNSSNAQLGCSRLRASSEVPIRHCIATFKPDLLRRRHSFEMGDLSSCLQCSICKKRVFPPGNRRNNSSESNEEKSSEVSNTENSIEASKKEKLSGPIKKGNSSEPIGKEQLPEASKKENSSKSSDEFKW